MSRRLGFLICMLPLAASAESVLCPEVVALMTPQLIRGRDIGSLPRIEVRRCDWLLQLVAWRSGESQPSLAVNTGRPELNQAVMQDNIAVLTLGSATYDSIVVIEFRAGTPKIIYQDSTKYDVSIICEPTRVGVRVDVPGRKRQIRWFRIDPIQLWP